ncbi:acyltransferase family protein [Lentzea californiensis]|uniref:acyltransferase family protein n=1 Tax=Lentzea californiensis TaxID=438851 RepID=UPI0021640B50|nr:acyltransferase [Lentzea californiensis]MCR3747130.1 Peptidoglycan/LPS O-acetylase OafA/YrhL, contains acyltransferase and SGNH-hydrolase domains [Lentzea californiensis]
MSDNKRYMYGLDLLRVIAAVAVIYNHYSNWLKLNHEDFAIATVVDAVLIRPLHLNQQLAFVGVGVFLMISGIVVTHVAFRETSAQFLLRRAVRLLPAMWVMITVAWVLVSARQLSANQRPDLGDLFLNLGLVNYSVPQTSHVLALTWTLAVQVVFYFFVAATMPLLKRWPWVPPAIAVALVSVLISVTPPQGPAPLSFVRMATTFLPVLFIGQLISLVRSKKIPVGAGIAFGVLQYLLFVRADLTSDRWPLGEAYPRTFVFLFLVLLLATRANGALVRAKWVGEVAKRTYAIYLVHIPVGFPLLRLLTPHTGYWISVAVALIAVAVASELLHRLVEEPIAQWYRRREKRRTAKPVAVPSPI